MSRLTASNIHTLEPTTDDHFEWDESMHGFGLRIRNRKHRTLIVQYKLGSQHRRINLGTVGKIEFKDAVRRAKKIFSQVADGIDPAEVKVEKPKTIAHSLGTTIPKYLAARDAKLRATTKRAMKMYLAGDDYWKPLHDMALAKINRADVAARLTAITEKNGPVTANRARSALSGLFAWAIGEGWCDANPVIGTNKRTENGPRERTLSDAEAARVWLASPDNDFGKLVKLILLTGCRRAELGGLKWSEIDFESCTITLPRDRTKNRQEHVVPLSGAALEILSSIGDRDREHVFGRTRGVGFSGWAKPKNDLDNVLKFNEAWTLHDLRRTVRTGLSKLGVQPHIAEAVINHLPPQLIRTYDRNTYAAEKRAALEQWATHLRTIVAQATGANVTALRIGDSAGGNRR